MVNTTVAGAYDKLSPNTGLPQRAVELVARWLAEAKAEPIDKAAAQLAGVLRDPDGLAFTMGFVDGVVRPEDRRVAARNWRKLVSLTPAFLTWYLRWAIKVGATFAPLLPGLVVPAGRMALRSMVRHLIVDASDARLGRTLKTLRRRGDTRLNINLLGEAILGTKEANRRLEQTIQLLKRDDVDYVSIKVSSAVAPHTHWAFEETVESVTERLVPLFRLANTTSDSVKFINLDMEEYKDLELTLAVFTRILDLPEFHGFRAGIVLQAYLPDALSAMIRLQNWAQRRVETGGAPIKVRVVKGANLPMEKVDAELHQWPLATWGSKVETDASYKAVLDYALRPEHTAGVRIGLAGHNLFDIAFAWLLAQDRGVQKDVDVEMLMGMATAQAAVVRREVGSLLLYTPIVHPGEFDVAIAYLVRRLEEGAAQDNFMSAVFEIAEDGELFEREKSRFLASVEAIPAEVPLPNRRQNRSEEESSAPRTGFANTADTDPNLPANQSWGRGILERMRESPLGEERVRVSTISDADGVDRVLRTAVAAGVRWRDMSVGERADILHNAGDMLAARRAELLEVMGSECGKVLEQGDPEVSEAIDFAHYYAESARRLELVDGAQFTPSGLTVVTPPWNFPVAIPCGSVLSALASGSPVVIKPARAARRCAAVMVEALWDAGVPRDVLQYVLLDGRELGTQLISDPAVERVILTGGYETAELFRSFRQDLPLLAETSGKNAVIITPSADYDLAARDVAHSAFGHAGQKCSAASLVILVGSVATSERFHRQLLDAIASLEVGMPWEATSQVGPVIAPPEGKLLRGLSALGEGESWLLTPRSLDDSGTLWSPGVRTGVRRGSEYHLTEYFGPILGVMRADSLQEAVSIVNDIDYGLTSGIHSLDTDEIAYWLETVEAGNLYVNRGITGAIVQRQSFGGWKKSAVGPGTKAGGPNYLVGLVDWSDRTPDTSTKLDAAAVEAVEVARTSGSSASETEWLARALATDIDAWEAEFGRSLDRTGLSAEQNHLRYRPMTTLVRYESGPISHLIRVVAAGRRSGASVSVSVREPLPAPVMTYLDSAGVNADIDDDEKWVRRLSSSESVPARIRLLGGSMTEVAEASGGRPDIAVYAGEVVSAGRVEMLPFLREQAVSLTAHRFGNPIELDLL